MLISELKQRLSDLPDDYKVVMTRGMVVRKEEIEQEDLEPEHRGLEPGEVVYEFILDSPIVGIAINHDEKDIRFVLEAHDKEMRVLKKFGQIVGEENDRLEN